MPGVELDTALGRIRVRVGASGESILFWPSLLTTGEIPRCGRPIGW